MSLNLNEPVFWERVDMMLCGVNDLDGTSGAVHRVHIFENNLEEKIRTNRKEEWKRTHSKNERFYYEITEEDKTAIGLITAVTISESLKDPYKKIEAKDIYKIIGGEYDLVSMLDERLENMPVHYRDDLKNLFLTDYDEESLIAGSQEAKYLLLNEIHREKDREVYENIHPVDKSEDYVYMPNIPLSSQYKWGEGWGDRYMEMMEFKDEAKELLPFKDWRYAENNRTFGGCDELVCGKSYVYIHPMSLSVYAKESQLPELIKHFQDIKPNTFKVGNPHMYEPKYVKDMTAREVYDTYKKMEDDFRKDVLDMVDGKKGRYDISEKVYNKHRIINSAEENFIGWNSGEIGCKFALNLVDKMIEEKVLEVDAKHRIKFKKRKIEHNKESKTNTKTKGRI